MGDNNFKGIMGQIEEAERNTAREKLKTTLIKLGVMEDPNKDLNDLIEALSAGFANSFGTPDKMYIDPNVFKALKSFNQPKKK